MTNDSREAFERHYADTALDLTRETDKIAMNHGQLYIDPETQSLWEGFQDGYDVGWQAREAALLSDEAVERAWMEIDFNLKKTGWCALTPDRLRHLARAALIGAKWGSK